MTTTKNTGMEILNVTVQRVKNTSENFSVFTGRDDDAGIHTVKAFIGPVRQMQRWCVAGCEVDDQRWGKQFVAQFATLAAPRDERELESFLTSGHVEGWGYHEYYGMLNQAGYDPFQMCSEHPEDLAELGCITPEMIASLRAAWTRGSGLAPVYAQLVDWGCTGRQSDALVKHFGFDVVTKLTENPYRDLLEVQGYGWKTAENIALCIGMRQDAPERIKAGIEVAVHEATWQAGSTWLHNNDALQAACMLLQLPMDRVGAELGAAVADGRLVRDGVRIYPDNLYRAEQTIAAQIAQRVSRHGLWKAGSDGESLATLGSPIEGLSAEQSSAVLMALSEPIALLTGGPGTGKTTCLRQLVQDAQRSGLNVTCMAPTGKAAARMTEATGYPATTIHSRLHIVPGAVGHVDDVEPVAGLVIVDEVSMLDTSLAAQMLSRISMGAQILLVGDPDQLPSVGPGAVLRDLIAADVLPRVHLDHVYRNEAGIAVNAARMREGKNILDLSDCQILPAASQEVACGLIIDMVAHHTTGLTTGASPLILTPTNDGPVGRLALNALLQDMLSPSPAGSGIVQYAGTAKDPDGSLRKRSEELRRGDRVMVTRNSTELGVFNGQVGTVVDVIVPRSLDVDIDGTVVTFAGENKRMVTLAYAITGHKSQGSEAPVVIAPIFPSRVLSREWLYTVITRAREHCILIGDVAAIQACISVQRCQERRTGLVEAIAQGAN